MSTLLIAVIVVGILGAVAALYALTRAPGRPRLRAPELGPAAAGRYRSEWQRLQVKFVDAPSVAVREADILVTHLMSESGYKRPEQSREYRAAHAISRANAANRASTEDLRRAMQHYGSLFNQLVGNRVEERREAS